MAPLSNFDKELLSSNMLGATTIDELLELEQQISSSRYLELKFTPIDASFDYMHYKKLHKKLFGDIYTWAGMDRYDMAYYGIFRKGNTEFTRGKKLPVVARALFGALEGENYFKGLDREQFIKSTASFLNGLNILHPFREGNGRLQRLFMEMIAQEAGYLLDLSTVSQSLMMQASILGTKGQLVGFEKLIEKNIDTLSIATKM